MMRSFNSKLIPSIKSKSDKLYIDDLNKSSPTKFYTDKEIRELIKIYQETKDSIIREKLIFSFGKYVASIAKNYQDQGLSLGDLITEGIAGLISAIDNFKLERKTKFVTYSNTVISRSMREALDQYNNIVKLPKNIRVHRMKTRRLVDNMSMEGATNEEILEAIDDVRNEKFFTTPNIYGRKRLTDPTTIDSDSSFSDTMIDETINLERNLVNTDLNKELTVYLKDKLTDLENEVICLYFGINKPYAIDSLEAVAQYLKMNLKLTTNVYEQAIRKLQTTDGQRILSKYL